MAGDSIFSKEQENGINSKLGDWFKPIQDKIVEKKNNNKIKSLQVIKVEGPFDDKDKLIKYVSKEQEYYYLATLNQTPNQDNIKNIKWAVSYDDEKIEKSFYLFSGGIIKNNKVRVNIQIGKNKDKFKIYSYIGDLPNNNVSVEVSFKQVVCFFIGGAGDKESYGPGPEPSHIVRNFVYKVFDMKIGVNFKDFEKDIKIYPTTSYKSYYIGYNDAYKDKIQKEVINKIPNKEGSSIFLIGHSLGGWNGAHLSQILTDKGYMVDMLITIDPVGTKVGVTLVSDIYWSTPKPKCSYWINIHSDSINFENDNIIADIGGQWIPNSNKLTIYHETEFTHAQAGKMFTETLDNYVLCSSDFLFDNIRTYLNK